MKALKRVALLSFLSCALLVTTNMTYAGLVKGIYLTQTTLEDTGLLNYLIANAKKAGITTFVVDLELPSKKAEQNTALIKDHGIQYVARIIMFPGGATKDQLTNKVIWEK